MKIHCALAVACLALAWSASGAIAQHLQQQPRHPAPPDVTWEAEFETAPIDEHCEACPDCQCNDCCCSPGTFIAGAGLVFVQPHFENDVAFYSTAEGIASTSTSSATNFNYDLELTPRVWLEYDRASGLGYRAAYWQFRHAAPHRTGTQSEANDGDPILSHATPLFGDAFPFGGFFLETQDTGDTLTAQNSLNLYTIDLEGTKWVKFDCWALMATAGVRYASVRQRYQARWQDAVELELGSIDTWHRFDGIGPTFSLEARRPAGDFTFFGLGRASLLYGNGKVRFLGIDQVVEEEIEFSLQRNDMLTIGELQVGVEYCKTWCNGWQCYVRTAMEGQVWQGAGDPNGEQGDLGLFGFSVSFGVNL